MIPYATCMCFRGTAHWRPVDQDAKRRTVRVSIDRDHNALLIQVAGPEEGYVDAARGATDGGSSFSYSSGVPHLSPLSDGDRLLLEMLDIREARPLHTGRFLTMNHKRRRRRLTTRTLLTDPALLDDIHHGQAQILLDRVGEWPFNAFTLDTVTGGRSVPILCVHLFHWYGLLDHFDLDVTSIWKLFSLVEEGYHSTNPYHNAIHAADVTQAMHCFLQEEKIKEHLTPLEIMAALIGAVTHDLDHPGVNQPFLIATSNHLAALYENTSVLENHHWRSAVGCLLESGVAAQLGVQLLELEQNISSLILATDITRQQEFLTRFKRYLDGDLLDMERTCDRHFILQIALKCADISNPCRPWEVSKKWSHKVCEEFFRQGDYERKLNLPVTSLCDRHTTSVPKIQQGFLRFVVAPLFDELHRFLKTSLSTEMMDNLNSNRTRWDMLVQQEQAEETRTEVSDAELPEVDDVASSIDGGSPDNDTLPSPLLPLHGEDDLWGRRTGRRHSVPLSAPREPTTALTIIRRESLPGEPHPRRLPSDAILHIEDEEGDISHAGNSLSLCSVCSEERPVSTDTLLPEPSIASITSSREANRLCGVLHGASVTTSGGTKYLTRQQTFPPLQSIGFPFSRLRYMSTTVEMSSHDERTDDGPSSTDTSSHTSALSSPECNLSFSKSALLREGKRGDRRDDVGEDLCRKQLVGKENRDPSQPSSDSFVTQDLEQPRVAGHRKTLPQGVPRLQFRRGSAPVGLLKVEEGTAATIALLAALNSPVSTGPVLSTPVSSNPERPCRRGSMPNEVSRQSILRSLGSKENTLPSWTRRSSLPYDLVRHSSSSLLECLNFTSGMERKKEEGEIGGPKRGQEASVVALCGRNKQPNVRAKRKALQRRSSGGPELFAHWWWDSNSDDCRLFQMSKWCRRRGSLPVEALISSSGV